MVCDVQWTVEDEDLVGNKGLECGQAQVQNKVDAFAGHTQSCHPVKEPTRTSCIVQLTGVAAAGSVSLLISSLTMMH